jgi:dihydroxyacetone kinase-like predicted kinase
MSYTETTIDENGIKHISSADEIEITSETVITSSTDGTVLIYLKDSDADLTEIPLQKTNEVPIESIELNKEEITLGLIEKLADEDTAIITLFYGEDVTEEEANQFKEQVEEKYEDIDVELYYGGQPLYYYLISVE